jgi:hypothetical protein
MENVGIMLWPFGIFYGNVVSFSRFGMKNLVQKVGIKIWQPCYNTTFVC